MSLQFNSEAQIPFNMLTKEEQNLEMKKIHFTERAVQAATIVGKKYMPTIITNGKKQKFTLDRFMRWMRTHPTAFWIFKDIYMCKISSWESLDFQVKSMSPSSLGFLRLAAEEAIRDPRYETLSSEISISDVIFTTDTEINRREGIGVLRTGNVKFLPKP